MAKKFDPEEGMGAASRWYELRWDRGGTRCWHRYGETGELQGDNTWQRCPEKDSWKPSRNVVKAFMDALVKRKGMR